MKRVLLMMLLSTWSMLPTLAQEVAEVNKAHTRKDCVNYCGIDETQASFPGGKEALHNYLEETMKWPNVEADVQGRVIVSFTVGKDGSLNDIKVERSLHPAFDEEALRVVKNMPKWIPGTQNGVIVEQKFFFPLNFRLK